MLESHRPHDMDSLAWRFLDVKTITYADVAGKGANQIGFEQVAVAIAPPNTRPKTPTSRCSCTTCSTRRWPPIRKLDFVYSRIEMPTREVLFRMEREGVLLDSTLLAAQSRELGERIMALEKQAHQAAGQPFNLASPKQLGEILFERMKLPVVKKTATGTAVDR